MIFMFNVKIVLVDVYSQYMKQSKTKGLRRSMLDK